MAIWLFRMLLVLFALFKGSSSFQVISTNFVFCVNRQFQGRPIIIRSTKLQLQNHVTVTGYNSTATLIRVTTVTMPVPRLRVPH